MIDLHSHVLPGMDDGSKSVEESLEILRASQAQGVRIMAATSHFYPHENSPHQYLHRRHRALAALEEAMEPGMPRLLPGAEVYYFDGISRTEDVGELHIRGTNLLLLEMPFSHWTDRMVAEIKDLNDMPGLRVLLAHIERYMQWQKPKVWDELLEYGVLMQSNAEFFLSWRTKRKATRMLKERRIHFIASDTHNTASRAQRIGEALEVIGSDGRRLLRANLNRYLPQLMEQLLEEDAARGE